MYDIISYQIEDTLHFTNLLFFVISHSFLDKVDNFQISTIGVLQSFSMIANSHFNVCRHLNGQTEKWIFLCTLLGHKNISFENGNPIMYTFKNINKNSQNIKYITIYGEKFNN